jgi:hypothetical protein
VWKVYRLFGGGQAQRRVAATMKFTLSALVFRRRLLTVRTAQRRQRRRQVAPRRALREILCRLQRRQLLRHRADDELVERGAVLARGLFGAGFQRTGRRRA